MASPTTFPGDVNIQGSLSVSRFSPPAASINNTAISAGSAGAYISGAKVQHQGAGIGSCLELFAPATSVAALTKTLFMARGPGSVLAFGAWIEVVASGADRTVTVDLQKSTGAGAYATVLSATAGFTNASAVRTLVSGTVSSADYVAGDIFRAVVTVAGSASAQATGLSAYLIVREDPS